MNTKIFLKTATLILTMVIFIAGCSLLGGSSPAATIEAYHRFAEHNNPQAMLKLFSSGYLEKNKKAPEYMESFADMVQKAIAAGEKPEISEMSETFVGEKAIAKWLYGSDRGRIPFQARLVKENGEWKIEAFGGHDSDLSKEEPPIERSKEFVREIETDGEPNRLVFSPDGKTLAHAVQINQSGEREFFIHLLDVQTGNVKSKIPIKAEYNIGTIQFSPDGKMFAATDDGKNIYVWETEKTGNHKQKIIYNGTDQYDEPVALAFAPDGSLYASGQHGSLLVYDTNTGKLKQKLEGHPREAKPANPADKSSAPPPPPGDGLMISEIVFSSDGKYFATAAENEVKVWDAKTNKALKKIALPAEVKNGVTDTNTISVAFAPDGNFLLTYSRNGLLETWNIQTGEASGKKELEKLYVGSAEFSRDGRLMTDSGGKPDDPPRGVKIYNAQTGEVKATFTGHRGEARAVFSPDGKLAASTSDKDYNRIFLWDTSGINQ